MSSTRTVSRPTEATVTIQVPVWRPEVTSVGPAPTGLMVRYALSQGTESSSQVVIIRPSTLRLLNEFRTGITHPEMIRDLLGSLGYRAGRATIQATGYTAEVDEVTYWIPREDLRRFAEVIGVVYQAHLYQTTSANWEEVEETRQVLEQTLVPVPPRVRCFPAPTVYQPDAKELQEARRHLQPCPKTLDELTDSELVAMFKADQDTAPEEDVGALSETLPQWGVPLRAHTRG